MPNNNVINTLSIEFEAEVKKALSSVDELVQRLTHLSHKVGEVRGLKLSLGIGAKTAENLKKFGEALDLLDLDKFKQFAEASQWVSKLNTGLSKDTGENLLNFAVAIEQIDVGKLYDFGAATSTIQPMSFGVGEKTGQNLLAFADALDHINVDKMVMVSAANANFHALEGIGIGEKTGKNLASFASALNLVDIAKLREFSDIGGSFESISLGIGQATGKNFSAFAHALDELDIEKLRELAAIDFSNIAALGFAGYYIRGLGKELDRLEKVTRKATEAQKKFSSSTKGSGSSAKGLLGRLVSMAKRVVLLRMIRTALQSITNGLHEGIENLYYWSQAWGTSFAPAMDRLATAQQYLKNGFASMFSPLIEYAIPIIDRLVDEFVDFFNFVQEGFAQLTGAATWNKARKVPVQYAEALDDASASAKELKHQLLGFDELNVLNTPTDSSRGSDKDAKDYSSMFELVETAAGNNLENIGEKLAEKVNKIFDDPERWSEAGEKLADFVSTGFDNAVSFLENVNWTNVGASIGNFIKTFTNKIATKIKDTRWGDVTDALNTAICDFIEGMPLGGILKALTKLITSILTAVPSIFLGSLEGTLNIIATILEKIGWNGIAGKFRDWSIGIAKFRKGYEDARGIVLDAMWNQMDYGSVLPTTERGFEYDPTIDGGRSFDAAGAVLGAKASNDGMDIPIRLQTLLNNEETPIGKIVTNFQTASDKIKKFFSGLIFPVKFVVGSLVVLVKTKYEEFQKWWKDKKDEIKLWASDIKAKVSAKWNEFTVWWAGKKAEIKLWSSDIKAKVLAKWNEFVAWWSGKSAEIKLWSTDIKSKVYEKWTAFLTWWNTLSAPIKLVAPSIINLVNAKWIEFKTWWGTKYADIHTRVLNHAQRIRDAYDEFKRMWGDKKADIIARVTATWALLQKAWENIQQMWGNAKNLAVNIVVSIGSALADAWSWIWKTWNNSDRTLPVNVKGRANGGYINGYASGGFPSPTVGSLFWAGEGGVPELLGTIGGRSAVAGGAEITGIRDAIYAQAENETALFRQLIAAVNAKDLTLTANSTTGRWVNKALKAYSGVTG